MRSGQIIARLGSCLALAILLANTQSSLEAAAVSVSVNMQQSTVSPSDLEVNIRFANVMHLQVTPTDASNKVEASLGMATFNAQDEPGSAYPIHGASFVLSFRNCSDRVARNESKRNNLLKSQGLSFGLKSAQRDANSSPEPPSSCPFAVVSSTGTQATVFLRSGILALTIVEKKAGDGSLIREIVTPIRVSDEAWELNWSAGVGFFDARDERYRLDPITADDPNKDPNVLPNPDPNNNRLVRIDDGSPGYKVTAFAHYKRYNYPVSLTFGLATDVPSTGIAAMFGVSFAAFTFPRGNSGYFTVGTSYSEVKKLAPDFSGLKKIPSSVGRDTLVDNRYATGFFLAFSFGFLGGEQGFKGRFGDSK